LNLYLGNSLVIIGKALLLTFGVCCFMAQNKVRIEMHDTKKLPQVGLTCGRFKTYKF